MEYTSFDAEIRSTATQIPSGDFQCDDFHRIRDTGLGQLAKRLAMLADQQLPSTSKDPDRPIIVDARLVRRLISARQVRHKLLPPGLFADPVWEMMLDLTAAKLEGRLVAVSSLCLAANVPVTTALRAIKTLVDSGLMERCTDPADARRTYISLSEPMHRDMLTCIVRMAAVMAAQVRG